MRLISRALSLADWKLATPSVESIAKIAITIRSSTSVNPLGNLRVCRLFVCIYFSMASLTNHVKFAMMEI